MEGSELKSEREIMKGTPFYNACRQGNASKVKSIMDDKIDILSKRSQEGMTLLHYAVEDGHLDVCKVSAA